jgi:hypothetical protein
MKRLLDFEIIKTLPSLIDQVIENYKAGKGKGWRNHAKSQRIKPGSKAFHALKQGQDLYDDMDTGKGKHKDRGKKKR